MKKQKLLKSLLVAVCLLVGASAWGEDEVYSWNSVESAYTDQSNNSTVFNGASLDNLQIYYTQFRDWGSSDGTVKVNSGGKIAFYKFDLSTIKSKLESEGGNITGVTFTFTGHTADNKDCQKIRALGYNAEWSASTITNSNVSNNAGTILGTVAATGSFQPLDDTAELTVNSEKTHNVNAMTYVKSAIDADKDYVSFAITANYQRAGLLNTSATLKVTYSTAARANYTIKYVDEEGNEIKTSRTAEGDASAAAVIEASDKNDITYNEEKYLYKSDDASGKTIASDNSTVVTITFRKAATYTYTVKSSLGTVIESGSAFENDAITYHYPQYELSAGTLYEATKQSSNPYYGKTFTLTTDAQEVTVEYTAKDITNVVYLADAENIEGGSASTTGNADIRCSNGKGAYFGKDVQIATLAAGKYKIYGQVWGNAGATFYVKAGNRTVWTKATVGYLDNVSAEFVITKETAIVITKAGDGNKVLDLIYIQQLDDPTAEELAEADAADEVANAAVAREALQAAITEAEAIDTEGKYGAEDLASAITAANTALAAEDATANSLTDAKTALEEAVAAFNDGNTVIYYVIGTMTNWQLDNDYRMALNEEASTTEYSLSPLSLTNSDEFKVVKVYQGNWEWYPDGENNDYGKNGEISAAGNYTVYFRPNCNGGADWFYNCIYVATDGNVEKFNVGNAGWATAKTNNAVDFSGMTTLKAYTATLSGTNVILTEAAAVPAGTALVLKGETTNVPIVDSADPVTDNILTWYDAYTVNDSHAHIYGLTMGSDGKAKFARVNNETTFYNKAVIELKQGNGARELNIVFGDETTGINTVVAEKNVNGIYNLNGQRVNAPVRGLYIVGGKKVIMK